MKEKIASAFRSRELPESVTQVTVNSTLRHDALHFEGKDWASVTPDDWRNYSDAYYGLNPHAFIYFLPSLLLESLDTNGRPVVAADSLISSLDTSDDPALWDEWFNERFLQLSAPELGALKDWAAVYLAQADKGYGSEFERVQQTLDRLLELAR